MSIAESVVAPEWVNSGSVVTGGLDLLGLRLPVQVVGGALLDGITSVTPSVRYVAFRAWLIQQYGQSGQPDTWEDFTNFSARMECALVLANLCADRTIPGLIGADQALVRLDAKTPEIEISRLVQSPAATIYAGPCDQLGVTRPRDAAVPALVAERGLPLAQIIDKRLRGNPLVKKLLADTTPSAAGLDELRELSAVARIDEIPDDEIELLIAAIIPSDPLPREYARIGTYAALLALTKNLKRRPTESQLFDTACSASGFAEPILEKVADGWAAYCVRDSIAVTQEAVMAALMDEISTSLDGGRFGVDRGAIVASLMERVEEHSAGLRALALIEAGESVSDLSFRQLRARLESRTTVEAEQAGGMSRWSSGVLEPQLYRLAQRSGAGALTLAVVAWILADLRVGIGVRENGQEFRRLSHQGWRRFGLRDVILPTLERWQREDRPVREVAAELADRTIQQHFQIAWSRLQSDPQRRDVALLTTDGSQLFSRGAGFAGGRTVSRVQQALGWMTQLKLIANDGITTHGRDVLQRALKVLSEGAAA